MTPAIEALKKSGIQYKLHEYSHNSHASSYGKEAADLLNMPEEQVFKTLVISCDPSDNSKKLAIAIVPVSHQLDLKALAKFLNTKKTNMADANAAQNATGYILGGISPLGQKKRLPYILDVSVTNYKTIFVSGGKRGLELEIAPLCLIKCCQAKLADIKV